MEKLESLQKVNRQQRLAEWSRRVEVCRSSGLTVVQWRQENGMIRYNKFRKLKSK